MTAAEFVVFTGPTLGAPQARRLLDAVYLPPASQGDVYTATRRHPWAIGIIDGYFERVPAVWHKEILWALSRGVRVYGSASMGALRAAELHVFGMRGVGAIFDAFAGGELEDDDEVTIVHGSEDSGYVALSEALVNIRWTLASAERVGVIDSATHGELLGRAKSLFYPDRTLRRIIEVARGSVREAQLDALAAWWPSGRVDQKRRDAEAMLRLMVADRQAEGSEPALASFRFQHTDAWEQVRRQIDRRLLSDSVGAETYPHDAVLDEVRLRPELYAALRAEALIRALALEIGSPDEDHMSETVLGTVTANFLARHRLVDAAAVEQWRREQSLSEGELIRLLLDDARSRRVREIFEADLDRAVADVLRLSGRYGELAARAQAKHRELAEHGLANPTLTDAGVDEDALWRWYFVERLGRRQPPTDREAAAAELGFLDAAAMRRTLLREYCYDGPAAGPDGVAG